MSALVPFPARIRFVNQDGTLTPEALRLLETLRDRVGGALGDVGADVFAPFLLDQPGAAPDIVQPPPAAESLVEMLMQTAPPDPALPEIVHQHAPYSAGTGLSLADYRFRLTDTAVTPGSYGTAAKVAQFTVDQQGRLTAASAVDIQIAPSQITGGTNYSGSFTGKTVVVTNGIITSVT